MPKIKNIEFLRIIAILAIILLHIFHTRGGIHDVNFDIRFYDKFYKMTGNGQKGVDFFFILSGLFFYIGAAVTPPTNYLILLRKKLFVCGQLWFLPSYLPAYFRYLI